MQMLTEKHDWSMHWTDRIVCALAWLTAIAVCAMFVWIMWDLIGQGVSEITPEYFFTSSVDAGRSGGIGPILVSTLLILLVCMAASVPLGVPSAILLAEFSRDDSSLGQAIRLSLDVLAAVPSIVFGLFGNAFFCITLGMRFSILSGGLTLACMVLPLLIRAAEQGLREVPQTYRQATAALGISRSATIWRITLPAAAPGVIAGLILGTGRALAETAALLFTSGYVDRMPRSLMDSGRSLSIHIYDLAMNVAGGQPRAYAAAVVLMSLLLIINVLTRYLTQRWANWRIAS